MSRAGTVTCSPIDRCKIADAKRLRQRATEAEAKAWKILRGRGIEGVKFRRQQIIAGFIVDFFCAELALALEIDGDVHLGRHRHEYDVARDVALTRLGVRVVRVLNDDVNEHELRRLLARERNRHLLPLSREGEGAGG